MSKTNTLEKYFFLTWQVTTTSQCLNALHISSSKYVKDSLNDLQLLILRENLMITYVINCMAELMFASVSEHCYSKKS